MERAESQGPWFSTHSLSYLNIVKMFNSFLVIFSTHIYKDISNLYQNDLSSSILLCLLLKFHPYQKKKLQHKNATSFFKKNQWMNKNSSTKKRFIFARFSPINSSSTFSEFPTRHVTYIFPWRLPRSPGLVRKEVGKAAFKLRSWISTT